MDMATAVLIITYIQVKVLANEDDGYKSCRLMNLYI
jgi:hypothetical protein